MKAKIGVKKKFNIIRDKKSIIIMPFKLLFLKIEMYKDDNKLKHKNVIKKD